MRARTGAVVAGALAAACAVVGAAPPAAAAGSVVVTPSTGLLGGDVVDVAISGFTPGSAVGWAQCVDVSPTSAENCAPPFDFTSTPDGSVDTELRVRRHIYASGVDRWVDCADPTEACVIGAAEIFDIPNTVVLAPIELTAPPPPASRGSITLDPPVLADPTSTVLVSGTGFRPGVVVDIHQCRPDPDHPEDCNEAVASVTTDGIGAFSTFVHPVLDVLPPGGSPAACFQSAGDCALAAAEAADFVGTVVSAPLEATGGPARSVLVAPNTGLLGGDVVEVAVDGFAPDNLLVVTQCISAAAVSPDNCGPLDFHSTDGNGDAIVSLRLRRHLYSLAQDRWVDCASPAEACVVGADDVFAGGLPMAAPITFATPPAPPATRGTITLDPPVQAPFSSVVVTGTGFRPGVAVDLHQCLPGPDHPEDCAVAFTTATTDSEGAFEAELTVAPSVQPPGALGAAPCLETAGDCVVAAAESADFASTVTTAALAPRPVVLPGLGVATEGDDGTTVLEVPLLLSVAAPVPVTVEWDTVFLDEWSDDVAAAPGVDYDASSGTVTFDPGETAQTVAVTVHGDVAAELDELLVVSFHDPVNARMGGFWGLGFGRITDDD